MESTNQTAEANREHEAQLSSAHRSRLHTSRAELTAVLTPRLEHNCPFLKLSFFSREPRALVEARISRYADSSYVDARVLTETVRSKDVDTKSRFRTVCIFVVEIVYSPNKNVTALNINPPPHSPPKKQKTSTHSPTCAGVFTARSFPSGNFCLSRVSSFQW